MATLKSVFPSWQNMWQGYSQNYYLKEEAYKSTLGITTIHILLLHSVYNYWKNDEFEDDEESAVDKIMTLIRAKAISLEQNRLLYLNIYKNLKVPAADFKNLKETIRNDLAPFYRRNVYPSQNISKTSGIQHQGLQYPSQSTERTTKPQQIGISEGRRQVNQTTFLKQLAIDKNWIPRLLNSFSQSEIDLATAVQEFHIFFCQIYPFEIGTYYYDPEIKEHRWKSKRSEEEIEVDSKTGQPLDDESLRDVSENEYKQWKKDGKEGLRPTWYLEGTYRFLGRLKKELGKKSGQSKEKHEQRIEAAEKLIKVYEKKYENPPLDFFVKTLKTIEGFEEYKTIIGNYIVNLFDPPTTKFRPKSIILVGYPGTGKSAIAKLTAEATKRAFIQVGLGGVDEPTYLEGREIAYGGADQGKILKEMLTKGSSQAVILLDEFEKAGSKQITDIVGAMTDPDQNYYGFEDKWLNWKIDLSQHIFILTANYVEKIEPFLLSRSQVVKVGMLNYQQRINLVKEKLGELLRKNTEVSHYENQITDEFCKYIITETWGVRETLANIDNVFSFVRAQVLLERAGAGNAIDNLNNIKEVEKGEKEYKLIYQQGQKLILVRSLSKDKGLDKIVRSVFTEVPDWPDKPTESVDDKKNQIKILDFNEQGLYSFDFSHYPNLEYLDIGNNDFKELNLNANSSLKILYLHNNENLKFDKVIFGESKKSLEEIIIVFTFQNNTINFKAFKKLKKLTFNYWVDKIHVDKILKNKIVLIWPPWQSLDDDDKLNINADNAIDYEKEMKNKVIFS